VNKKKSDDNATTEEAATTEAAPEGATTAPETYTGPTARLAPSAPRAVPERQRQVNVADWAAAKMERREIGGQLAYAFVQGYPTDTATPSELEQALQAFRSRPIEE
jgi:hypothetical protein